MSFKFSLAVAAAIAMTSAAHAGQPDNPGARGDTVKASIEAWKQDTPPYDLYDNFGDAVSSFAKGGNYNLGQALKASAGFTGGTPNSDNDNGGGND